MEGITFVLIFILVLIAIFAIAGYFGKKKREQLLAEGKIVNRKWDFYKDKEIFKANIQNPRAFYDSLTAAAQSTQVCSMSGNYNSEVIYKGRSGDWTASLVRLQTNDGSMAFSFGLTWYRSADSARTFINLLLTAIEKTFIQYDPNTQVTLEAISFQTKSSMF